MTDLPVSEGMGDFKKWEGDPSNGRIILTWGGGLIPLYGL